MRPISYTGHVGAVLIGAAVSDRWWYARSFGPDPAPRARVIPGPVEVLVNGYPVGTAHEVVYEDRNPRSDP